MCDYPEHVPPERWASYARQQKALGLHFVRLAEFAWSRLEPSPGQYDWAWLDQAIETSVQAGLKVVLCTPTAAPPAWLVEQHPDILPVGRDGQVKGFGSRRHYDFSSPVFREHSRRITRAMAERYGQHPALIGWQTDNEFGWGDTAQSYSAAAHRAFQDWLQRKYGTLAALNDAWGNVFWSMEYSAWAQVPLPGQAVAEENPAHRLDFMRFSSAQVGAFQREQVEILREHSPGRFVTHNYMGFFSAFDHYAVSDGLDFASWDSYPTGTLEALKEWHLAEPGLALQFARTGHPDVTAFNHDLYRGICPSRTFWIMEQQCGQVNWAPTNPLPAQGAVRLWTEQAWAHGTQGVSYFRWRAATMGQEVMHSGLLRHNETPDRGYAEVQALKAADYPDEPIRNRVALLHDYESLWVYNMQPHAKSLNYWAQTFLYYRALRALGVDVDIIHPDQNLDSYDVIVAPALTVMTPERARHLEQAASHARLVFGPRTAFRTASACTPETGQFGPLTPLMGAGLLNYDSLPAGLTQNVTYQGKTFNATLWAESYELIGDKTQALGDYLGGPQDAQVAVSRHGNVTVIGAHSAELVSAVLEDTLTEAGLTTSRLPEGVRISRRGQQQLIQNWNDHEVWWKGQRLPPISTQEHQQVKENA